MSIDDWGVTHLQEVWRPPLNQVRCAVDVSGGTRAFNGGQWMFEDLHWRSVEAGGSTVESRCRGPALPVRVYYTNNPSNQIWLAVASACQQIANLLIIYRLAEGSAWDKDTLSTKTTAIHFRSGPRPISTNIASFHIAAPMESEGSSAPKESELKEESRRVV